MPKYYLLLTLLGVLAVEHVRAQQSIPPSKTEFVDSTGTVLPSADGAVHRRETQYTDSVGAVVRLFYLSGKRCTVKNFEHLPKGILHGTWDNWFENGQLSYHANYEHGKIRGEMRLYYPNGQLKRRDNYTADFTATGECFAEDGKPIPYFKYETLPVYPEGDGSTWVIVNAVARNVVYPRDALRAGISGKVFVSFVVNKAGRVVDTRVVQGVSPSLDSSALLAVRKLRNFKPGQQDGKNVNVSFTVPITFAIE
jgi:protein TonB